MATFVPEALASEYDSATGGVGGTRSATVTSVLSKLRAEDLDWLSAEGASETRPSLRLPLSALAIFCNRLSSQVINRFSMSAGPYEPL